LVAHRLAWQEHGNGWRLYFLITGVLTWIDWQPNRTHPYILEKLRACRADDPDPDERVGELFSIPAMTHDFREQVVHLIDRHRDSLATIESSTQVFPTSVCPLSLGELQALAVIGRVCMLAMLDGRPDAGIKGKDYLKELYGRWRKSLDHSFESYSAMASSSILFDTDDDSCALTEDVVGRVPHIASWLVNPADRPPFQPILTTVAALSDEFCEDLVGRDGLVWRYPMAYRYPMHKEVGNFLCLETVASALDSLRLDDGEVAVFRLHERCLWEVGAHLGTAANLDELGPTHLPLLDRFYAVDPNCYTGQYVVAMVHELFCLRERLCQLGGERFDSLRELRDILGRVSGYSPDPSFVRIARTRLALFCLGIVRDTRGVSLPEVGRVFRLGSLAGLSPGPLPFDRREGPTVEFKSTFEWNKRLSQRDAKLRLGVFRTICAFMNSNGGTLYIGVKDNGEPIGVDDDFALIDDPNPEDVFAQRLAELLRRRIEPFDPGSTSVSFPVLAGKRLIQIEVKQRPGVTYLREKSETDDGGESIYVRDGNRTVRLQGRERDRFVLQRFRHADTES